MKKLNKKSMILIAITLVCLSVIFYYFTVSEKKEGFEGEMSQDIENEILKQYMDESLDSLDAEELKKRLAASRARLAKFGLYPSVGSPDLSKYVLKSQLGPEDDSKCIVAKAEDRDKYIPKSAVPEPKCPGVDMSKYVLKSSIQPEKICPPPKEIDYSRYVLKSTIPPAQKCPPCVCPKVKVSAGLCKACPPPPKLTCPEVKPCPRVECPAPQSCPPQKDCQQCHSIKTVKVPIVLKREVRVNERGEIVSEIEEEEEEENNNKNTNNKKKRDNKTKTRNNDKNNEDNDNNDNDNDNDNNNKNDNNNVVAANETQEEIDKNKNLLSRYYKNIRSKLTTDRHNDNSELLNNGVNAYGRRGLNAYNPTTKPLSDAISSNLSEQNNASLDDNQNGVASLNELMANQSMDNGQKFNIGTRQTKPVAQPYFTSTLQKPTSQILGNNMLTNQPKGLEAKCGPVKFNNVFRKYGVYGTGE